MRRLAAAILGLAACGGTEEISLDGFDPPPAAPLVRPDTPGNNLLFNFDPGDVVESFASAGGRFRVHFTRDGTHAVPPADADSSGVPDYVEEVAEVYDEVIDVYEGVLGFRAPVSDQDIADNGGDERFDVYLVDFGGSGDGHYQNDSCDAQNPQRCAGFMVHENDFVGYGYPSTRIASRIVGSHELFHAVQAAYDIEQGSVLSEGSAVWATEQFDPSLPDFEHFLDGYLQNPDRSLDTPLPGPVDPFSYGAAIFFQFLEERFGDGAVRALWERCENGAGGIADPLWFEQLDALAGSLEPGASFASAFVDFATWNLFLGADADPARSYADGAGYPPVKMNDVALPFTDERLRVFYASAQYYRASPAGRAAITAALIDTDGAGLEASALLLAAKDGSGYGPVLRVSDPGAGSETVDAGAASEVTVIVINTNQGGDSLRPALCIGTVDEVDACRAGLGEAGAGGMGGGGGAPPVVEEAPDEGCGCRAAGSSRETGVGALVLALGWALAQRRRRRSTHSPMSSA